ncbi:MAG TPA: CpaD family pilus assembly lipoprotein [Allosphingosinicella sp.]
MFRTNPLPFALAVAAGLCATGAQAQRADANRSMYSTNQPVVQRTDYAIDLASGGEGLGSAEQARLVDWLESLQLSYGDRLYVDTGYEGRAARGEVSRIAAGYGMMLSPGAPMTAGPVPSGVVRVIISRTEATVPNCPNWERSDGPSKTSSNYGCAVNSNLAAMIADPNDLVLGQAGSVVGDATTASKAIRAYRQAVPTGADGLKDTVTKGGK